MRLAEISREPPNTHRSGFLRLTGDTPQTLGGSGFRTTPEIHLSRGGANGTLIYNISLNKRSNHLTGSSGGSLCGMSDLGGRRIHPVVSEEMEGIGRLVVG